MLRKHKKKNMEKERIVRESESVKQVLIIIIIIVIIIIRNLYSAKTIKKYSEALYIS